MASATGLVLGGEGDSLLSLTGLTVTIDIGDDYATVVEQRSYASFWGDVARDEGEADALLNVRFYRTIPGGDAGSVPTSVTIAGQAVQGELLFGAEADAVRRTLVGALWESSPLKHMGEPLWVSEVLPETTVDLPSGLDLYSGSIQVTVELEVPLRALGTLRGVAVPMDWARAAVSQVSVTVNAKTSEPLRAVYSPYHPLLVTRDGTYAATATFSSYSQPTMFDIQVLVSTGTAPVRLDLMPFRYDDEEGGHVLALLTPETEPGDQAVVPRDIAIVLDRSGSMHGEKMSQARTALKQVLDGLRPQDHVAVITFATNVTSFHEDAVEATPENISAGKDFVDTVAADGGTNIYDALKAAFSALPLNLGNPRYVVLLTDGIPTEGETDTEAILEMVRKANEVGARIVSFGIGDDVNTVLLEKLANETGGDAIYIRPGFSITDAVAEFFDRLTAPILANPVLDLEAFGGSNFYPATLPDLFAGQTVAVLSRYATPGTGQAVLRGVRSGDSEEHTFNVTLPEFATEAGFAPKIWATRHIGTLLHDIKLNGIDPALVAEVLETARRYGIVTEFTFYRTDEDGDSSMTYSEVPMDSVGDQAVATSAALDGYEKDDAVRQQAISDARFTRDRALPYRGGWFTDTYPRESPAWIDLTFGSDAFWALAQDEVGMQIGAFLAVGRNVRFEHLGRTFRITDPNSPPDDELPTEAGSVPAPRTTPTGVFVSAEYAGAEVVDPVGQDPIPTGNDPDVADLTGDAAGCTTGHSGSPAPAAMLLLMAGLLVGLRRRTG